MTSQAQDTHVQRVNFPYHTLRSVTSPEDTEVGRKRYTGVAPADSFFALDTDANVRAYLSRDQNGDRRKGTKINAAILDTLENNRDAFALLNTGITIVAEDAKVDDNARKVTLVAPSIINGAQTQGVLKDYFTDHPDDREQPSVNFELIVTDDEELVAEISIARNFQNEVKSLSIFGRQGRFDELEKAMQRKDKSITLRKSETDFGKEFLDTEKLVQVLTAIAPQSIKLPSAEKRKVKTPETIYRVYAYRHRSRCLTDFAEVMDGDKETADARAFFLDVAFDAWQLYLRLRSEQSFSRLQCVSGEYEGGRKIVARDGVPDGIVFPMLSALSRFIDEKGHWKLAVPAKFPWKTFFDQAMTQEKTTAANNPQTMGKKADCYVALHGSIDMFFAMSA
jgi:hypothetical protein